MLTCSPRLEYLPVKLVTLHLDFPTVMVAVSLANPVPVTVKRVPSPSDPEKSENVFEVGHEVSL